MRLTVSDPAAIPDLLMALRRGECVADRAAGGVDVAFPWVATLADARQAIVELTFFARAWELSHPGLSVALDAPALG
jgi:hypothetical protein